MFCLSSKKFYSKSRAIPTVCVTKHPLYQAWSPATFDWVLIDFLWHGCQSCRSYLTDRQTFATLKLKSTPRLTCRTCIYVFVLRESTAVTSMCTQTRSCVSLTVPLHCTEGWKRTTLWVKQSQKYCTYLAMWHSPETKWTWVFVFTVAFFPPLPAVPREATESSTTRGVIDHQRDVGHYCCTSLKLPVSTAASEIVLQ